MTDDQRDELLRKLEVGMAKLSTLIAEGVLRRVKDLEEAQNNSLSLIGGLQEWRGKREKALAGASGEASGRAWAWGRLVAALTVAGGILTAIGGCLKVLWDVVVP